MNKIFRSALFMFIITLFFTSLVTAVKMVNEDRIKINREIKLQRTVLKVLGIERAKTLTPEKVMLIFKNRIKQVKAKNKILYICRDEDGEGITGYAFPLDGPGFWGPVYAMAAVNQEATRLLGISFYRHSETPGLGGRISEDWFSNQFKGLLLETSEKDKSFFSLTPEGDNKTDNELDAITGASRTSEAVELFLNRELKIVANDIKNNKLE
ncbi:FMN-binding protein [Thermodesulfobacteriota bacterium]